VGGKIAQLGQRLIDGAAKMMAEDFFKRFDEAMQRLHPDAYAAKTVATNAIEMPVSPENKANATNAKWVIGAAVAFAAAFAVWLFVK
jgi:hypothetical protein